MLMHAAFAVAVAFGTPQNSANADTVYNRAARLWRSLESVEATFEQQITNTLIGRSAVSRGIFLQQRPGKISVTFTDPVGDRIVGDGSFLWVYLPSSAPGQVMKLPANAEGAVVADLLGQLLDSPSRAFLISGGETDRINGNVTRHIILTPRNPAASAFRRAAIWVDEKDARPVRVQVLDAQGVDRTITLTTWRPNVRMAKDAFTFSVPRGVKVVTNPL